MTRDQAASIVAVVRMLWPHSNLGGSATEVVGLWHSFLESYDRADVEAAVRELAAQGREHAPPVGVVVKTIAVRDTDIPGWDEVRAEILKAVARYRPSREEAARDPYAAPPAQFWSHPIVAEFMDGAWREWRMAAESDGTFNAQQREAWKALAARVERRSALVGVGAPRRGDLRKPDLRVLPPGGTA